MAIIIIRTLIIYFALVLSMRLMGKRQLGELELPELIVAVLIADLAAHPLQDIGIPLMNGLIPIVVLFCCEVLISGATMKSSLLRSMMFGKPCFLVRKGVIDQQEMQKNRFTLDELTEELRSMSITDISRLEYAVLETDGTLSTLLFPSERPATVRDLGIKVSDKGYPVMLINDGKVIAKNLRVMGRDESWLKKELTRRGFSSPDEVYVMMLDDENNVYFAPKEAGK
ncbi:MAG: DUF421 domain-containing protein [Oscillospiraceae bacterium]